MENLTFTFSTVFWPVLGLMVFGGGLYALTHAMQRKDLEESERLRWLMCIVLIPLIGPFWYLLTHRNR